MKILKKVLVQGKQTVGHVMIFFNVEHDALLSFAKGLEIIRFGILIHDGFQVRDGASCNALCKVTKHNPAAIC